jgi:hypothetical protein
MLDVKGEEMVRGALTLKALALFLWWLAMGLPREPCFC